MDPLAPRGEGAGGFISIAPRKGGARAVGGVVGAFDLAPARDLEGGDGERDLDGDS